MRHTSDGRHGWRVRAMIVVLWRAGLRIQEALALAEHDLDQRRGSILVRNGKGGRRREVRMDEWGWEQLRPWLNARLELPVGPLFCIIDGPTRGRPWSGAAVRMAKRASGRHGPDEWTSSTAGVSGPWTDALGSPWMRAPGRIGAVTAWAGGILDSSTAKSSF
jgi:integrase